ncbi:small acid-soluble spore protein SspI [Paenactinomyces guangxiensis]|uniref:Small, acid-soluble spore protein I n=1 Tax=Paenactinomyces guangxiensis TaxID=1490290 RepID=A0A7W2A8D7_9BACL|nr:small acid-soluble spore protein SspI [Paenactinomyces guangxiensis]MBA4494540.1 small acid-soluble spore protein SspI [Paenactinomyces guangxiensis]MBH8591698.1 small acid-soluble spore protein SspI [Paenactinomyces guangxiensis]
MNINIRNAVINNIHNMNTQELQDLVQDSIKGDEKLLPGLGVLFEVIWENSPQSERNQMIQTLQQNIAANPKPSPFA